MGRMRRMGRIGRMGNSHQAKRYPSSFSAPIYLIKRSVTHSYQRAERVLKCQKGLYFLLFGPFGLFGLLSQEIICCQKGAECYTRQKCHRGVVLDVRPIGGIFSRGRNRPLITTNYTLMSRDRCIAAYSLHTRLHPRSR